MVYVKKNINILRRYGVGRLFWNRPFLLVTGALEMGRIGQQNSGVSNQNPEKLFS
jgi:hypothetical protein